MKGAIFMFLIDCKQASIYSTQNDYLCHATVSRIEEDSVTLTIGGTDNDLLPSKVHVTFFDSVRGLITYSCELFDFKPAEHLSGQGHVCARCVLHEQLALVQRRRDIKVPVNIPIVLSAHTSRGKVSNVLATIWNISAGGILFTCSHPFNEGDVVEFSFPEDSELPAVTLQAEILRIQDRSSLLQLVSSTANESQLLGFGCYFVHLSAQTEARIRNYVYRQDLIRRRRMS